MVGRGRARPVRLPRTPRRPLLAALALAIAVLPARAEDDLPYPPGRCTRTLEGLKTTLVLPPGRPAEGARWSLVIALHGAGGAGSTMADRLETWATGGYVLCAPKAKDLTWEPNDLESTLAIAKHLMEVLPIDPKKVHVVGYENGGDEMSPLVFDDDLKPRSAAWLTSGYRGTQVPRWAKATMAVIAVAGTRDPSLKAARRTVPALRKKVRHVELRVVQDLGHRFPISELNYLRWWVGAQEGRLVPGEDLSFLWEENVEAAVASQATVKKGGVLVWFFTREDAASDVARTIQHRVFFSAEVRFLAGQIPTVRLDAVEDAKALQAYGVKTAPALVVLDREGEVRARFEGEIEVKQVVRALKKVAPKRTMPKD